MHHLRAHKRARCPVASRDEAHASGSHERVGGPHAHAAPLARIGSSTEPPCASCGDRLDGRRRLELRDELRLATEESSGGG